MKAFDLRELDSSNIDTYVDLLSRRGRASRQFYEWKFTRSPHGSDNFGYLAFSDEGCIGGIGFIRMPLMIEQSEISSTWFADWYVASEAQGLGIGLALIENVRSISGGTGFGSPAPVKARKLSSEVGYSNERLYRMLKIGIERPGLLCFKKIFNTIWHRLLFRSERGGQLRKRKPNVKVWTDAAAKALSGVNHFVRDGGRINWMLEMPLDKDGWWWTFESAEGIAFGNTQKMGSRIVANVLDIFTTGGKFRSLIGSLVSSLQPEDVDELRVMFPDEVSSNLMPSGWKRELKLLSTGTRFPEYLSLLDIESSWVALEPPR